MTPIMAFRFELTRDNRLWDALLLFAATATFDDESLATAVEQEIDRNLTPDEAFIVVRRCLFSSVKKKFNESSILQSLVRRVEKRTTFTLVAYDHTGHESNRAHIAGPKTKVKIVFDDFRRRAVTNLFSRRGGFVNATSTYHFENPSGRHTEQFIKLSNILVSGAEIAFVGFCTLPLIPENTELAYIDTPSLFAIVASISEQRCSLGKEPTIICDNFGSYQGVDKYEFTRASEAVVLISASSSGGLAAKLVAKHGIAHERIVHMLFLGTKPSVPFPIVCDLSLDAIENPEGFSSENRVVQAEKCPICANGSVAIKLQGDQFEIAGPQPEPLLIRIQDAPRGLSELMHRLVGRSIFRVGLGRSERRATPRQFNIDPELLLQSSEFAKRLDYILSRVIPAQLSHIIPISKNSETLAQLIVDRFKNVATPPVILDPRRLSDIPACSRSPVAIVASVIESGRSLQDVSRDLRSIIPSAPMIYIVGFSKTTAEARREALVRNLVQANGPMSHEVVVIERLVLPSSMDSHAWTAELDFLREPVVTEGIPETVKKFVESRVERLRQTSQPLIDDLFVPNAASRKLSLQPGFVFWPPTPSLGDHSQADVFFTIASVLQRLRANTESNSDVAAIRSSRFHQTVLSPGNFSRYNDDIIQASLLRAARPHELNFGELREESREIGRLIRRIVENAHTSRGGAAAEFLLAIATRRLRLCPEDRDNVLKSKLPEAPIVGFLLWACKAVGV